MVKTMVAPAVEVKERTEDMTSTPTEQQSLILMRNLMRTSISIIAYLRQLFPGKCFEEKSLAGVPFKALIPGSSAEARTLANWLEKGVFDALNRKYLRKIIFGVYLDPKNPDTMLECFTFHVSYPNESDFAIDMVSERRGAGPKSTKINPGVPSKAELRKATVTVIRVLDSICGTLQPIPEERFLTMKLFYYDDRTPIDYEPEFFRAATPDCALCFDREPFQAKIGDVSTPFHTVKMRLATVVDSLADTSVKPAQVTAEGDESDVEDDSQEFVRAEPVHSTPVPKAPKAETVSESKPKPVDTQMTQDDSFIDRYIDSIRHNIITRGTASLEMIEELYPQQITRQAAIMILDRLLGEGLLIKDGNEYTVAKDDADMAEGTVPDVDVPPTPIPTSPPSKAIPTSPPSKATHAKTDAEHAEDEANALYKRALEFIKEKDEVTAAMLSRAMDISHWLARLLVNRMFQDGFVTKPVKGWKRHVVHTEESQIAMEMVIKGEKAVSSPDISSRLNETHISDSRTVAPTEAEMRHYDKAETMPPPKHTPLPAQTRVRDRCGDRCGDRCADWSREEMDTMIEMASSQDSLADFAAPHVFQRGDETNHSQIRKRRKVSEIGKPLYQRARIAR